MKDTIKRTSSISPPSLFQDVEDDFDLSHPKSDATPNTATSSTPSGAKLSTEQSSPNHNVGISSPLHAAGTKSPSSNIRKPFKPEFPLIEEGTSFTEKQEASSDRRDSIDSVSSQPKIRPIFGKTENIGILRPNKYFHSRGYNNFTKVGSFPTLAAPISSPPQFSWLKDGLRDHTGDGSDRKDIDLGM